MSHLFRKEAVDHQSTRLYGDVIISQPTSYYLISCVMLVLVLIILAMLYWGTYARKEVVIGYLSPSRGVSKLFPLRKGIINQIKVQDGQNVMKGDELISISTKREGGDNNNVDESIIQELEDKRLRAREKILLEKKLTKLERIRLHILAEGINKDIEQKKYQLGLYNEKLLQAQSNLEDLIRLHDKGLNSKKELIKGKEVHINQKIEYNNLQINVEALKVELAEIHNTIDKSPLLLSSKIANLKSEISSINQQIIESKSNQEYFLYAPINGKVTALQAKEGQSVELNTPLMVLMPKNSTLEAIALIPTKAIGFIRKKQEVKIRYLAFPYQRYGIYNGKINNISKTVLSPNEISATNKASEPVYRVSISINEQTINSYGNKLPLQAGMMFEADIILENLSFIDWALEPLYRFKGRNND